MQPNLTVDAILPLGEMFAIRLPGEYRVLASLPVVGEVDAILTAANNGSGQRHSHETDKIVHEQTDNKRCHAPGYVATSR